MCSQRFGREKVKIRFVIRSRHIGIDKSPNSDCSRVTGNSESIFPNSIVHRLFARS